MKTKVVWSPQVQQYVHSKAPEPRRILWREIKNLAKWNGQENPPVTRHLEDQLAGYSRLRVARDRVIFREDFERGQRVVRCLHAGPRSTVYECFEEILLDEMTG
jgi:mRNA-degrading endonuclease RelE of RelBE toxin-antitoxin system